MGRIRKLLVQYLTKKLLKALTPEDVLTFSNRGWFLNNRKLAPDEIGELKEQARNFRESFLWNVIRRDIEYAAFVTGRKAKTDEENLASHYMFYNLDVIERFLENCTKL